MRDNSTVALVAEAGGRVVGYMLYHPYAGSFEVLNFAVHKDFRRRGLGAMMLKHLTDKLKPWRRRGVWMHVGDDNLPMHLLLRKEGFKAVNIERAFYKEYGEKDAYLFAFEPFGSDPPVRPGVAGARHINLDEGVTTCEDDSF